MSVLPEHKAAVDFLDGAWAKLWGLPPDQALAACAALTEQVIEKAVKRKNWNEVIDVMCTKMKENLSTMENTNEAKAEV